MPPVPPLPAGAPAAPAEPALSPAALPPAALPAAPALPPFPANAPAPPEPFQAWPATPPPPQVIDCRDRRRVEGLCKYITRPPVATDRLERRSDGKLDLAFKKAWRDGTRALVFEPADLIARLVAAVPPSRRAHRRGARHRHPRRPGRGRLPLGPTWSTSRCRRLGESWHASCTPWRACHHLPRHEKSLRRRRRQRQNLRPTARWWRACAWDAGGPCSPC